jgi:hypothetical protein
MDEEEELYVHKHLLSERTRLFKADIDKTEGKYLDWAQFGLQLPAASRYVGFLYGQPIWTYAPEGDIYSAWHELTELYQLSTGYEDFDTADACIDGMRDILQNWRDGLDDDPFDQACPAQACPADLEFGAPDGRLIVDYMVHRPCDIRKWIDAYGSCEGDHGLEEALSKKFAEEAQRKKDKIGEPDLMERCRYHLHVEKGLPCYLDK